jgi:hypothetical protein
LYSTCSHGGNSGHISFVGFPSSFTIVLQRDDLNLNDSNLHQVYHLWKRLTYSSKEVLKTQREALHFQQSTCATLIVFDVNDDWHHITLNFENFSLNIHIEHFLKPLWPNYSKL